MGFAFYFFALTCDLLIRRGIHRTVHIARPKNLSLVIKDGRSPTSAGSKTSQEEG